MIDYKIKFDDVTEEEATIEISNLKFKSLMFRTKEEALTFVHNHCPNLWTKLKRKTENGWVIAGSILPEKQVIKDLDPRKLYKDYNTMI